MNVRAWLERTFALDLRPFPKSPRGQLAQMLVLAALSPLMPLPALWPAPADWHAVAFVLLYVVLRSEFLSQFSEQLGYGPNRLLNQRHVRGAADIMHTTAAVLYGVPMLAVLAVLRIVIDQFIAGRLHALGRYHGVRRPFYRDLYNAAHFMVVNGVLLLALVWAARTLGLPVWPVDSGVPAVLAAAALLFINCVIGDAQVARMLTLERPSEGTWVQYARRVFWVPQSLLADWASMLCAYVAAALFLGDALAVGIACLGIMSCATALNSAAFTFRATQDRRHGCLNEAAFRREVQPLLLVAPLALVCLDVRGQRVRNATWGLARGDAVIRALLAAIHERSHEGDRVGRFRSGELFWFRAEVDRATTETDLAWILAHVQETAHHPDDPVHVVVGVAFEVITHGDAPGALDDLLEDALAAALEAKVTGQVVRTVGEPDDE